MTHSSSTRFLTASLFVLALSVFSTSVSFGALNMYLKLKGANGKSYIAKPDETGKFTFSNVEPGTYKLLYVGSPEVFESSVQKGKEKWIEIQSFSWGATNSGSISSGSAAGREASTPSVSEITVSKSVSRGTEVAAADVNGDGRADRTSMTSPKTVSFTNPKVEGSDYSTVILDNVVISSACSPSGKVSGWNLKENVK